MIPGLLFVAFIAATFLFPAPARAQTDDSLAYAGQAIAPAVVPQGEFAARLAEALALGIAPDDENGALHALAALGVAPAAGWQPDQAMTPQTVAELRAGLADAIDARRLVMEPDAAWTAFDELLAELGLPLPAEPVPAYAGANPPLNSYGPYCDATATHYFYGNYGLPIYSYCYPPAAYFHYYSWVPCGFRAHGHHFAGFFVFRQVHHIQRVHGRRHFGHRFDGRKHERGFSARRSIIRVIQPPKAVHDTKSAISRTQSGVMEHKSQIMQRLPPAMPSRVAPARPAPGRAVRFGERVSAVQPRQAPTRAQHVSRIQRVMAPQQSVAPPAARATPRGEPVRPRSGQRVRFGVHPGASAAALPSRVQRDARIHRETAPRRIMAPSAARAAPVARPAPRVATQPVRHQPNRAAASWSQRAASAMADPRAQAREVAPVKVRFGRR
jgi:hypothetical protein